MFFKKLIPIFLISWTYSFAIAAAPIEDDDSLDPVREFCIIGVPALLNVAGENVFDIAGCSDNQVKEDIKNFLIQSSGRPFEWFSFKKASLLQAIEVLATDYSIGDGSAAFSSQDIEKIIHFYASSNSSRKVEMGEFASSYYSGTEVMQLIFFYTAKNSQLILISKLSSAE